MWGGIGPKLLVPYSLTTAVRTLWYHTQGEKKKNEKKKKKKKQKQKQKQTKKKTR